jgi:HAE1 family hydrophobic/amphiphilic exporter-1
MSAHGLSVDPLWPRAGDWPSHGPDGADLTLIGIVVTNAIVLIDLVNQYRRRGLAVADAVAHGASRRLRPILMTALATIAALTPMAIGLTGHGGFISQPLAIVVIGGLISSTVLTLVVLPTLYNLVEGRRERKAARKAAKVAAGGGAGDGDGGAGDGGAGGGGAPATDGPVRPEGPNGTGVPSAPQPPVFTRPAGGTQV